MVTAITALLIASLAGGIFGSVATYTYVDETEGKYCEQMAEDGAGSEYGEDSGYYEEDPYEEEQMEY
jgi:hypothetical protein